MGRNTKYVVMEDAGAERYFPLGLGLNADGGATSWTQTKPRHDGPNAFDRATAIERAQALGDWLAGVRGGVDVPKRLRIVPATGGAAIGWAWVRREEKKAVGGHPLRARVGDVVRLYGFPGTFELLGVGGRVRETTERLYDFYAESTAKIDGATVGWPIRDESIVEINGMRVPLMSCPIAEPADDYPHEPAFDYHDGPEENGKQAHAAWMRKNFPASA